MSTIDNREIIKDLLKRRGVDRMEGAVFKSIAPKHSSVKAPGFAGVIEDGKHRLLLGPRYNAETIWEYTTGFGGVAWKLIYGMYPNGWSEVEAEANFMASANIKPGTKCRCLLFKGELTEAGKAFITQEDTVKAS